MSRIALTRPRRNRAVWDRPATDTRLLPTPHSRLDHSLRRGIPLALSRVEGSQERNGWGLLPSPPQHTNHYKRCLQAERLRPGSDQSLSLPVYVTGHGRSPDKNRLALSKGSCQVRAALNRRIRFASSGDAHEHGVIVLHRAIAPPWASAPFSDSTGADPAGQSEQSDNLRLKTNAPYKDSTVVTIGELRSTNAGHGSPLPSLGAVEHFWWSGLPHTENFSGLVHIPSEVRGCRKAGFDVEHPLSRTTPIGTGVAAFLRNRPGPSIPSPSLPLVHLPSRDDRPVAQGVGAPSGAPTPLPPTQERDRPLAHTHTPFPHN